MNWRLVLLGKIPICAVSISMHCISFNTDLKLFLELTIIAHDVSLDISPIPFAVLV